MALIHRIALSHRDFLHNTVQFGGDDVLHLHGFHDEQLLTAIHRLALVDIDADNCALHGRRDRNAALRPDNLNRRGGGRRGGRCQRLPIALAFAEMQHRQGIASIDLHARQPGFRTGVRRWRKKQLLMLLCRGHKIGDMFFNKARVDPVFDEIGMAQQALQKRDIGRHAFDLALA